MPYRGGPGRSRLNTLFLKPYAVLSWSISVLKKQFKYPIIKVQRLSVRERAFYPLRYVFYLSPTAARKSSITLSELKPAPPEVRTFTLFLWGSLTTSTLVFLRRSPRTRISSVAMGAS